MTIMDNLILKSSLADVVADKLLSQIQSGKYQVNDKLPIEPELMKAFGVGRSTIREAIKVLAKTGLLRVQQGVGTFVERVQAHEPLEEKLKRAAIADVIEVRELLEMRIAEKAACNRTETDLLRMHDFLVKRKELAEKGDTEGCIYADMGFHVAIAEACGNNVLLDVYRSASAYFIDWFLKRGEGTGNFLTTHALHETLYHHIKNKDSQKALQTAEQIIGHI